VAKLSSELSATLIAEGINDRSNPTFSLEYSRARPDQPDLAELFGVPAPDINHLTFQDDTRRRYGRHQYGGSLTLDWRPAPATELKAISGFWWMHVDQGIGDGVLGVR